MTVKNTRRLLQRGRHPHLFRPLALRSVVVRNRIMMSPMCQLVLGRILLNDPHWPLHAANALKATNVSWPVQYERANIF
jgi:2,4-dienoyl-CoA reductase-like NADH-dependent reductase (Old Yellow Enzyme family)